jgi:hypothetical protein
MTDPGATATSIRYPYMVIFYIADPDGDLVFRGQCDISQDEPMPTDDEEAELALVWAKTAKSIRARCDQYGNPAGRVLIAAVLPTN